jgi:hypothetical protein
VSIEVRELTGFVAGEYDAPVMRPAAERPPVAQAAPGDRLEVVGVTRELGKEWDEAFAGSYGQRFWNIGCG